jgi:hypothetical protein
VDDSFTSSRDALARALVANTSETRVRLWAHHGAANSITDGRRRRGRELLPSDVHQVCRCRRRLMFDEALMLGLGKCSRRCLVFAPQAMPPCSR